MPKQSNKYTILREKYLTDKKIAVLYEIIKNNMANIGFDVSEQDKNGWTNNLKEHFKKDDFYFYVIYNSGDICGFIEIVEYENKLIVSEVQLDNTVKGSRLIVEVIDFILTNPSFSKYNNCYFSINKNNTMSKNTFTHLGAKFYREKGNKVKYGISRIEVEKYLEKLAKFYRKNS